MSHLMRKGIFNARSAVLPPKGSELSAETLTFLDIVSSNSLNRDQKDRLLRAVKSPKFRAENIPWANAQQLYDYLEGDKVRLLKALHHQLV